MKDKSFKYNVGDNINGWLVIGRYRGTRKGKKDTLISQKMYTVRVGELIKDRREDVLTNRLNKPLKRLKTAINEIDAACNRLIRSYKRHAKNRGLAWNLNKEEFKKLTTSNCYYCNIIPKHKCYSNSKNQNPYIYNGIDRIDNKIGYEENNCVPCCGLCNQAKMDLTYEEFKKWVKRLSQYFPF